MEQDFSKLRKNMVDNQLLTDGVIDHNILSSMGSVPREHFVSKDLQSVAYSDIEHQISSDGRYLLSPVSYGRLLQLSEIKPSDIVLVVGCSLGYLIAVIANLASAVVGVEQDEELIAQANSILTDLDVGNGVVLEGSLEKGIISEAPFDVIIIEGAVDRVPQNLISQLRDGGRLIAVRDEGVTGVACVYIKSGDNVAMREMFNLKIPPLGAFQTQEQFIL